MTTQMTMNGWRPIATAPRDGREIDLWVNGYRVTNAAWSTKTRDGIDRWVFPEVGSCTDKEATHWMPLPEPPNEA